MMLLPRKAMAEHFKRTIQNTERNIIKFIETVTMKAVGVSRTTMYESPQTSRTKIKGGKPK